MREILIVSSRLDIMAATSEQMESGYRKIHRWCQFEFRQFTKETQLEVSPAMNEAIRRLRARPALLKYVYCNTLLTALTGGPGMLCKH